MQPSLNTSQVSRRRVIAATFFIVVVWASITQAAIITLQDGTDGYAGTEDTSLQQDAVNRNWGARTGILSGPINDSGTLRVGLLRFDLTGLSGQFTAVNSMSLKLTVLTTQSHATGSILTASLQKEADGEWVEGTGNFADNQAGSATWNQERHGVSNWASGAGARGAASIYGSLATQSGMSPAAFPVDSTVTLNFNPAGLPSNVNSLTEIVNLWNTPGNNAGIHLENGGGAAGSNRQYQYYSSEHATVASRPLLQLSATGSISWDIAGSGNWNTSTANWKMGTLVPKVVYENADAVNFTNTAGGVITIQAGGVSPGGVNVSATSGTYEFTGGAIGGSGALTKSGTGTLILSNINTYTGGTTVTSGVLQVGNDGAGKLGPSDVSVADGATLRFFTTSHSTDGGASTYYSGKISGAGDVVVQGAAASRLMRFSGDNSGFTGKFTVVAGSRASLHNANSGSASAKFVVDGTLSGQAGNGSTYHFGELSGAATGFVGGGGSTNNVSWSVGALNSDSVYHGTLNSNGGGLTKVGNGTLRLTNMSHGYTGPTNVNGGILQVDGSIASSSGVSVAGGARLAGSGFVPGISGAGLVSPGTSPGILTSPSVNPASGLDFAFEFTSPGSPNYATPSASINDVLSLTAVTPFASALDADNTVGIYFDVAQISVGDTFRGGFFVDNESYDLLAAITNADWQFFVRGDGGGNVIFNGTNYYPMATLYPNFAWEFSTALENNGRVLQLTATPEPAALLAWCVVGVLGLVVSQRFFSRRNP